MRPDESRRTFLRTIAASTCAAGASGLSPQASAAQENTIQGFDDTETTLQSDSVWQPVSERKIRVGIAGYGVSQFGAHFGFQDHPNVEVAAVTDLIPERCQRLAQVCGCDKTYPSLEEMVQDDSLEAIFVATDAPSHAQHCIDVLEHGKHVCTAVPAVFGSLEDADRVLEAVKRTGLKYMMFETSAYHSECYAMRVLYNAGEFGRMIYSEGEYYHYMATPIDSFKGWRVGLPPQWYPTHSNAYYTCVTGGSFTEVSCMGIPSTIPHLQKENNAFANPFGTEIALMRTSEGGMARMAVSWDTPGNGGEKGRVRGERGSMDGIAIAPERQAAGLRLAKPPLPPSVDPGGHGGSHGYLMDEFVTAILQDRTPLVNVAWALNMSVAGVVSHQSALKDGELLKIPQYAI